MRLILIIFFIWTNLALATSSSIIVIQGSSSCGKTTTAKTLQQMLANKGRPFMLLSMDKFMSTLPKAWVNLDASKPNETRKDGLRFVHRGDKQGPKLLAEIGSTVSRVRSGTWAAAASFAKAGNDVILEGAFLPLEIDEGEQLLSSLNPLFVFIRCSLKEAEKREKDRGGFNGLARGTAEMIGEPKASQFNLIIDTTQKNPEDGATIILAELLRRADSRISQ